MNLPGLLIYSKTGIKHSWKEQT